MKAIFNWRYYVIYALFSVGLMSLLLIVGEDERPLGAWLETRLYLAAICAASFYTMNRLRLYWEAKGEIKSYPNI